MSYDPWRDMATIHNFYLGKELVFWTLYENTADRPGLFVVRPFVNEQPLAWCAVCNEIEPLRERLEAMGLTPLARSENDDPTIIETWF